MFVAGTGLEPVTFGL